jgi:hypothetical protein
MKPSFLAPISPAKKLNNILINSYEAKIGARFEAVGLVVLTFSFNFS